MKKLIYVVLMFLALGVASCVEDNPYLEPEQPEVPDSSLKDVLVLNEINGSGLDSEKYIELYNNSNAEISLAGISIFYNNVSSDPAVTWTGTTEKIAAKGFLLLKGTKKGDPGNEGNALSTGLSGSQGINVEIRDGSNARIDQFQVPAETGRVKTFARIPDGTGGWYYDDSAGTAGKTNGTVTTGKTPIVSVPIITDLARSIATPKPDEAVEISAKVTVEEGTSLTNVVLEWTLNGTAQASLPMTATGDTYKATIAKQANASEVTYKVVATNNKGGKAEASGNYTVSDGAAATKGKVYVNECDPDAKQWELYNSEAFDINLGNWTMIKDNDAATPFTFAAGTIIPAGGFLVLTQNATGSPTFGMSGTKGFKYDLSNAEGTVVDVFDNLGDNQFNKDVKKGYTVGRLPDGGATLVTFSTGTMGASNAGGVVDNAVDYTVLVINEVDGNGKFVEIYNKGDAEISLTGVTLYKNSTTLWWTGGADAKIAAKGFYTIAQAGGAAAANELNGNGGISPKKAVQFDLKDPTETTRDSFKRCPEGAALDIDVLPDYGTSTPPYAFARCPDGTGAFGLAMPSCNVANPATAAGPIETTAK